MMAIVRKSSAAGLPVCLAAALLVTTSPASADEWSYRGNLTFQLQGFTDTALHSASQSSNASLAGTADLNRPVGENGDFTISPFFRVDQHDDQRTHFDLREFL